MEGYEDGEAALDEELADLVDASGAEDDGQAEPARQVYFANVWDFVYRWLRHMYKRNTGPNLARWSPDWFRNAEVVSRLTEVWRVWEMARVAEGTSMASWWRDYCDPAMDRIMSPDGPFRGCGDKSTEKEPLGCNPPPSGQFIDERTGGPYTVPADDSLG